MTELDSEQTEQPEQTASAHAESGDPEITNYLYAGAVVILSLAAVFAAAGLYSSVMSIIDIWIAAEFKPIFRLLLHLSVLLFTIMGISAAVRRMDTPLVKG